MTAALAAAKAGLDVLIIEKADVYGGTSATSGGGCGSPCNHLMPGVGVEDNPEECRSLPDGIDWQRRCRGQRASLPGTARGCCNGSWRTAMSSSCRMREYADYYQHIPGAGPVAARSTLFLRCAPSWATISSI